MAGIQDIENALRGIRARYQGQGSDATALQEMVNYAQTNAIPMADLQAAAQRFDPKWTPNRTAQTFAQYQQPQQGSGMAPAMSSYDRGLAESMGRFGNLQNQVGSTYGQGMSYLQPYMGEGTQASALQSALSGAMGGQRQQEAFQGYQASPGVQFAQQEAERALTRNAAATGGLGGANVRRDLSQLAAGTYMQDFNNQFARLGEVANRGYGAATTGAGLMGQQAQVQGNIGATAAQMPAQVRGQQAGMQFQAGRDIASGIGQTSSALANLINQQGAGMADMGGSYATNMNNLYQQASQGNAQAQEQLAALLGNMSVNAGSQVGGLPIIQGQQTNYLGQLGQVAGGIGGIMAGMNSGQPTTNANPYQISSQAYGNMLSGNLRGY